LEEPADLALVVGGYNSSNTSHLVDLCAEKLPTYFINGPECLTPDSIAHFDYHAKSHCHTQQWLPSQRPLRVLITSGASCPDATVEGVVQTLLGYFEATRPQEDALNEALSVFVD
jgi:4-hydroxy-3-methylbut-2-enyl diphosphate reductase